MATALCNELAQIAARNVSGLGGSSELTRSTAMAGRIQAIISSFTVPSSGPGSAQNDLVMLGFVQVQNKIVRQRIFFDALGGATLLSSGKIDMNDSTKTDAAHYINAISAAAPGNMEATLNMGEQFGADPVADLSVGQLPPGFGQASIILTLTFTGGAPTLGANIIVITEYVSGS